MKERINGIDIGYFLGEKEALSSSFIGLEYITANLVFAP